MLLRRAAAVLSFASALALTPHVFAQGGTNDAGAHFDRGVSFFKDADYTAAMVEFKKAYELEPNYKVLYNLGQTSRELHDYAAALSSFERYLTEGGAKIDADRRRRVETWVGELRGKVGQITLDTNVTGADVSVDDVAVGTTPLKEPIVVNAGRRKLSLLKAGYAPRTQYVDVAGTENKSLHVDVVALSPEPAAAPVREPARASDATSHETHASARPWIMVGVTSTFAIAAAVVGGVALGKKAAFDDALARYPTSAQAIDDARSSARTFAITADVLAGIAVASGITTVALFALDHPERKTGARSTTRAARSVDLTLAPSSVAFTGAF